MIKKINTIQIYFLILMQILDGVLTYFGVCSAGLWIEGNPLVRYVMSTCGILGGLLLVKTMAILILLTSLLFVSEIRNQKSLFLSLLLVNVCYVLAVYYWILYFLEFI